MSDQELIKSILSGDQPAFRLLIKQHERLIMHMVYRLVDNEQDREELCQDIFMKVYDQLSKFNFDSKLSTWIATIANRMSINWLQKKNRQKVMEDIDKVDFKISQDHFDFESIDYSKFIHSLIAQMPPLYKNILTLYHLEGFSYSEIVEVTALPEGTVKNYLFRARNKLKELSLPYIGTEILPT